ncbi:hypothetical protein [Virgibacillus sp. SK37]|uniref:hypothetical protein n=1 Tax=Virgibacillus sp. SK37 TaxID=403957 RepID=UPI0004D0DADE|nr:hypothetical protein [Virgibacillus sp. SK37]AIF42902.1 hypothetical protein X953_06555 [Virgibacillus sp. SK37]
MGWLLNLLITILILVLQHFLSTRRKPLWGGLLPVFYIIFLICVKLLGLFDSNETKDFWFIAILGTTILLSIWASGRESLAKKRKKELEKMESHDLR